MQYSEFISELKWRGLIHDMTPGTEELLSNEQVTGYVGFDPTADSLHIGNLVPVMLLVHFQRAGHKPVVLVGGATGRVGDPSGKTAERKLLPVEEIQHNLECQKNQLKRFLNFDSGNNRAEIVNNYDWFKDFTFLDFIRDVGKHITVNYMLAKDSVKKRLESGMSFTEFSYQLVQGYDFYWLYRNKNCKLQMGGSDQWGNIVTGTELIRRKYFDEGMGEAEAFALTAPLITKSDGSKFGKSEGGNVWLDPEKTTPYEFYQFWLNVADEDVSRLIRYFTLLPRHEIEALEKEHAEAPHLRVLQKALAKDVTVRVHSESDYEMALKASEIFFGKGTLETLRQLDEKTFLTVFKDVPAFETGRKDLSGTGIIDMLAEKTSICKTKSEARRMLKEGSILVNKNKVKEDYTFSGEELLNDKYLLIQRGKKNFFVVKAV